MNVENKILKLSKQLLPTGKAWKSGVGSNMERLWRALAVSESKCHSDVTSILSSLIPDNSDFTADDATQWEARLGLVSNPLTSLTDRKAAILRKMAAPGRNRARGHYLWIQKQLRDAGFDVYVHENLFYDPYTNKYYTKNPATINSSIISQSQHGDGQHGDFQSAYINHMVVNSIDNNVDIRFNLGGSLRSTFFIGGAVLGTMAMVPATREIEFRQLILTLKQTQNAAILFILYT